MFEKRKDPIEKTPEPSRVEPDPKPLKSAMNSRATATIGETICIEGTITGTENLIIEGTVTGAVSLSQNDLTIGRAGKITADLSGKSVKIDGVVGGDITASEVVVVSKTGQVKGNITAPRVTLEDGAKFKGSIDMEPTPDTPVDKPQQADSAYIAPVEDLQTADAGRN